MSFRSTGFKLVPSYLVIAILLAAIGIAVATLDPSHVLAVLAVLFFLLLSLVNPIYSLYIMLFFVPLQNLILIGDGSTLPKLIGYVLFFTWSARKLIRKEQILPHLSGAFVRPGSVFLITASVSIVVANDFSKWQTAMLSLLQLVVWSILLIDLLDSHDKLEKAMLFICVGSLISFAVGAYNYFVLNQIRSAGLFGGENASAALAIVLLPFLISYTTSNLNMTRLFGMLGMILAFLAIGASVARTAILLLPFVLVMKVRSWIVSRHVTVGRLLPFILGALIVFAYMPWNAIEHRLNLLAEGDEISPEQQGGRAWRAEEAFRQIQQSPLYGYGLGNALQPSGRNFMVHNLFLQIMVELGIVGLLVFIWLLANVCRYWKKAWSLVERSPNHPLHSFVDDLQISLMTYFIYSLTVSNYDSRLLWLLLALPFICFRILNVSYLDRNHFLLDSVLLKRKGT